MSWSFRPRISYSFSPCQSNVFPRKELGKGFVLSSPLDYAVMYGKGDATEKENIWPYYR